MVRPERSFRKPICPRGHDKRVVGVYRDGLCKRCSHDFAVAWSRTEAGKTYAHGRQQRTRLLALLKYGGKCACCGEAEPLFLQFDHVNDDGKTDLGVGGNRMSGPQLALALLREPRRLDVQVLCSNCHAAKTAREVCPHLAVAAGKRKVV